MSMKLENAHVWLLIDLLCEGSYIERRVFETIMVDNFVHMLRDMISYPIFLKTDTSGYLNDAFMLQILVRWVRGAFVR